MTFLLETNAFSDLMRDHPQVDARLANLPATDRVVICSVVRGEIRYGILSLLKYGLTSMLLPVAAKADSSSF